MDAVQHCSVQEEKYFVIFELSRILPLHPAFLGLLKRSAIRSPNLTNSSELEEQGSPAPRGSFTRQATLEKRGKG